jgi:hypothetical protein
MGGQPLTDGPDLTGRITMSDTFNIGQMNVNQSANIGPGGHIVYNPGTSISDLTDRLDRAVAGRTGSFTDPAAVDHALRLLHQHLAADRIDPDRVIPLINVISNNGAADPSVLAATTALRRHVSGYSA